VERAPNRATSSPCAFSSTPATSGSWLYQPAKKPATLYRQRVLFMNAERHVPPRQYRVHIEIVCNGDPLPTPIGRTIAGPSKQNVGTIGKSYLALASKCRNRANDAFEMRQPYKVAVEIGMRSTVDCIVTARTGERSQQIVGL
jgi:hypothetical protein